MENIKLAVIGLGYVGLPLARLFATRYPVGYDVKRERVAALMEGRDATQEVSDELLRSVLLPRLPEEGEVGLFCTSDAEQLRGCNYYIVAVPTPVDLHHSPDLTPLYSASETVGKVLDRGDIVIYESTVCPGITEDECVPILERTSGLVFNRDFFAGYSPERINPGDKEHTVEKIMKVTSGSTPEAAEKVDALYRSVIQAGTFPVSSIKVAEAAKVIENSQRDINIAFMNELAMVFDRMDIDTNEVVDGMNTKWNALGFRPGLVGGHCIGVDPYYFTYEAEKLGYHSQIILNGRILNDNMGAYIADKAVKQMILAGQTPKAAKVVVLGLTFKEGCPDIRNTKVVDIIKQLGTYGIEPVVVDPWADREEAKRFYGVELVDLSDVREADCIIAAVAHEQFRALSVEELKALYRDVPDGQKVLIDVKGIYPVKDMKASGMRFWRL